MTARTMVHHVVDKAIDAASFVARKGGEGAVTVLRKGHAAALGERVERISDTASTKDGGQRAHAHGRQAHP